MTTTSEEQRKFFAERGYLSFGRIYEETEVEELREALAEVESDRTAKVGAGERAEGKKVVAFNLSGEGKSTPTLVRIFRVNDVFFRHVMNPVTAQIAAELLDAPAVRLMEDQVIVKAPGVSGPLHWHQDYVYWPLATASQVSCWLALDYVTPESGGMQFVPGSHLWGEHGRVSFDTGETVGDDERPKLPVDPKAAGYEVVATELQPGEAVFHHSLTWHATAPNTSDRMRRGLITRYMTDGTRLDRDRSPGHPIARLDLEDGLPITREDEFPLLWPR